MASEDKKDINRLLIVNIIGIIPILWVIVNTGQWFQAGIIFLILCAVNIMMLLNWEKILKIGQ